VKLTRLNQKQVSRLCFFISCIFLLAGLNFFSAGCSYQKTIGKTTKTVSETTQKIKRKIRFSDDDLQRIAVFVGFENRSLYQTEDFAPLFRKGIPDYLNKECDDVTVTNPDAGEGVEGLKELPRLPSGQLDNFALAVIGRKLGLNAVITGRLDDIGLVNETRGLLLKDNLHLIQVLVSIEVYDTETATKILDESFSRKVEIDELDYQMMRSKDKLILPDLSGELRDLIAEMGERICWAIEDQPWNGFITSFVEDRVVLSAGSRSGLEPGDRFEVFDNTRIMKGRGGEKFLVHGPKLGEIKIVTVNPRMSEAVVVSDKGIKTGSAVRVK
jgi:hypothetical protein